MAVGGLGRGILARGMGGMPRMTAYGHPMFMRPGRIGRGPVLAGMSRPVARGPLSPGAPQPPSVPGSPSTPDVRDPQYFTDVANIQNTFNTKSSDLNAQDQQGLLARNTELSDLAHQQPLDILRAQQAANRAGLFYSGALGKQEGEINYNYAQKQAAANQKYSSLHDAILRQLGDLGATYGPEGSAMSQALLNAGGRAMVLDAKNGVTDPLSGLPASAPSVAPAARSARTGGRARASFGPMVRAYQRRFGRG